MPSEIELAFDHPEARSRSMGPADRISLRDHIVEVEIGAFQPERGTTQRVKFNVVVEVRAPDAPLSDDVDRILSYDTISEAIASELGAQRMDLLETLANNVANRILLHDQAQRCFVRIEKLDRGPGALGVEIVRSAAPVEPVISTPPRPLIVHLSNDAIRSDHLGAWLDQLEALDAVILTVGLPEGDRPLSSVPAAQRRIDLLAIEQNAWVLAGRDRRCVVVSTRTELDWAMRNGQISVWAPSKLVLDSVDVTPPEPGSSAQLSGWFASQMQAREMIMIGGTAVPFDGPVTLIQPSDSILAT